MSLMVHKYFQVDISRTVRRRASRAMWWWCGSQGSSEGTHCVRSAEEDRRGSEGTAAYRRAVRAATRADPIPPHRRCTTVPTQVRPLPLVCSTIQIRIVVCACPVDPLYTVAQHRKMIKWNQDQYNLVSKTKKRYDTVNLVFPMV